MRGMRRLISFGVGLGLFWWLFQHAGGFHQDGTPVDPNPPPLLLFFGAMVVAVILWLYSFGLFQVLGTQNSEKKI